MLLVRIRRYTGRWSWLLAIGLLAAAVDAWLIQGSAEDATYDVISASSVIVMVVGAVRAPRAVRRPWLLVTAGFGCWTVGDVVFSYYEYFLHREAPYPSVADGLYLLGYPLLVLGLVALSRLLGTNDRAHSFGDAVIISLGVGVVVWQVVLSPAIDISGVSFLYKFVTVAYPGMDLVLLLLVLRSFFAGVLHDAAAVLLAAATGLTLVADVISNLTASTGLNFLWLCGYVLAAAAVHQAGGGQDVPGRIPQMNFGHRGRFVLLGLACCAVPFTLIYVTLADKHTDVVLLCVVSVATISLVVARLSSFVSRLSLANTEQARLASQLQHRATHDDLTQILNRAAFLECVDQALVTSACRSCAVAFIDLDGFKGINDGAGHHVGDELLVGIAERLRSVTRAGDLLARLGGDEFAVLVQDLPSTSLHSLGERLVNAFETPFATSRGPLHIRASIGIAQVGNQGSTTELLANADAAMYTAKERGRNRYVLFDEDLHGQVLDRLNHQQTLEDAIRHNRMEVHYQPVVSVATGAWLGLEALVRCRLPDGSLLPPADFLPVAEQAGLMQSIDG